MEIRFQVNIKYIVIIAISLIINTLWVLRVHTMPYSDFLYYHDLAIEISKGGPWGDTYTTVGYPAVLGLLYRIFGAELLIGKLFNVICTTVNTIICILILGKCKISEKLRILTMFLFAFYPINIVYNGILANEILFTTILLLLLYIYLSNINKKHVLMGLLIAAGAMIKPFFMAFSLCLIIMDFAPIYIYKNALNLLIRRNLICILTSFVCISPWTYRNTMLVGELTFISNNGGLVLYVNNNSDNVTGKWMPGDEITNSLVNMEEYKNSNATQKNKMLKVAAKDWILKHPLSFMELGGKRFINTFYKVDDIDYAFHSIPMDEKVEYKLTRLLRVIKEVLSNSLFFYIMINFIIFIRNRILNLSYSKNARFDAGVVVITLFFAGIYFIAEGQGRYSFPLNFFSIYTFAVVIQWFYKALMISFTNFRYYLEVYRS